MARVHVTAKKDFIESLTSARPLAAISELIWNGFDAGSDHVRVSLERNQLDGLQTIRVRDYGYGIDPTKVEALFGGLGDSWKKYKVKQNGRALHGKNGKGRFKAFALGGHVEWRTTFKNLEKAFSYRIVGRSTTIDDFETSDPIEVVDATETGTEVIISNIARDFRSLQDDSTPMELAKIFAAYLTEYPDVTLEFDSRVIDPKDAQECISNYHLGDVRLPDGRHVPVAISIIEWKFPTERVLHLCDANGVALHEVAAGQQIRAPGFNFTAYIKADAFRELDKSNLLVLAELHDDVQHIVKAARNKVKEHFRRKLSENQSKIVENWKREEIYPYDDKESIDAVELAERQVFDILAVNVQSYLPSFEGADQKSRRFTFQLLAQAIKQNPESVQIIIGEVLGLKKEAQDELAALLKNTSLSAIISSAKIVANRLNFLNGLEALIFEKENKKALLERDQLHKILENEAWLFHEEFGLAGSELRLNEVLAKHLAVLGPREEELDPVEIEEGKSGRVDLMLHKVTQPRTGEYDYLIVELKRPKKKIDAEVLTQIEKYAIAVANDERFRDVPAKWAFLAVSTDLDAYAQKKARQREKPKGLVYDDEDLNLTVWAKPWADVINDARAKLSFINQQLSYEVTRESAMEYLHETHAKFIPDNVTMEGAGFYDSTADSVRTEPESAD